MDTAGCAGPGVLPSHGDRVHATRNTRTGTTYCSGGMYTATSVWRWDMALGCPLRVTRIVIITRKQNLTRGTYTAGRAAAAVWYSYTGTSICIPGMTRDRFVSSACHLQQAMHTSYIQQYPYPSVSHFDGGWYRELCVGIGRSQPNTPLRPSSCL